MCYSPRRCSALHSRDDPLRHFPRHIREPKVAALETTRQPRVINAAKIKHRHMQVVDVHGLIIFDETIAQFIITPPGRAAFDAASQPDREREIVMIAARALTGGQ